MGARLVKFDFVPKENEQIEAVIRIPEEKRSVINGVVKDWCNKVVEDAVVKLFEVVENGSSSTLKPITHTFTDEYGQFLFGPICAYKKYVIKVWFNDVRIREMVITPEVNDECEREADDCHEDECECEYEQEYDYDNRPTDNRIMNKRDEEGKRLRIRRSDRYSYRNEPEEEE